MIYQAKIENGIVVDIIVADDNFVNTLPGLWVSYNESERVGVGHTYNEVDGFRPPKPYPSWVWSGIRWEPPTPLPDEENIYEWDEENLSWVMMYIKVK